MHSLIRAFQTSKSGKLRAVLFTKEKKVPLLWKVLAQKYSKRWEMAIHKDEEGTTAQALLKKDSADPKTKVVVFTAYENVPLHYQGKSIALLVTTVLLTRFIGKTKFEPLSKHFKKLIDDQDRQENADPFGMDMEHDEF